MVWYRRELVPQACFCEDILARVPRFQLHFKPGTNVARLLTEFDPAERSD
jgi:hypothetical protein